MEADFGVPLDTDDAAEDTAVAAATLSRMVEEDADEVGTLMVVGITEEADENVGSLICDDEMMDATTDAVVDTASVSASSPQS